MSCGPQHADHTEQAGWQAGSLANLAHQLVRIRIVRRALGPKLAVLQGHLRLLELPEPLGADGEEVPGQRMRGKHSARHSHKAPRDKRAVRACYLFFGVDAG